jgi:hypothetical protein
MLRTWTFSLAVLAVAGLLCVGTTWAQSDTYFVTYYSHQHGTTDGHVRMTNPGYDAAKTLCADIYVFDAAEELIECCGCSLTADDMRLFDIDKDLTNNAFNGEVPSSGVIEVVSALPNLGASGCDPTGGNSLGNPQLDNIVPQQDLRAWAVHVQVPFTGKTTTTVSEEEFADAGTLNTNQLHFLEQTCFTNQSLGSGKGVCSCGTGK